MVTHRQKSLPLTCAYDSAMDHFGRLVRGVTPDQWGEPTPCRLWTVRNLVNHVTVEHLWLPALLAGTPATAVGDSLDGDRLGSDPVLAFKRAATEAQDSVHELHALDGTVRLWSGRARARHLVSQLTMDTVVHSWDLARAVGADERLPAPLISFALQELSEYADRLASSGLFDAPLPLTEDSEPQTRLLALTGRRGSPYADPPRGV
ncbi:TIGR03086 family metal-binding protein [Streptacidiphilus jiangxiensis]|uniref:TIGR03086 family protein n=1 Tax=Streptacidiphilus jiangxiensis TaxID=235985 RepID=A0A1H7HAG4_STRJI|nr:TIGR03086 family metal-binding protein [Streptacidiphilus jiangxiensis]SEK47433.1 TIGR03086 family protein [Streptacidiphilus jiangxiensis]